MNATKLLLILPLLAAFAYISLVSVTSLSQARSFTPVQAQLRRRERASWGQNVYIQTSDGEALHGLYSQSEPGQPSVLFFLGKCDRVSNYGFFAQALAARASACSRFPIAAIRVIWDARTKHGLLIDGIAAFDWLAERSGNEIVVLASRWEVVWRSIRLDNGRQSAVILVSAYLSVLLARPDLLSILPGWLLTKDPFRSDLKIAEVRQPKLFIHGRHDTIIPLSSGDALYQIAPERQADAHLRRRP